MLIERFSIVLPRQDPQIVEVRLWGGGASRLALKDRFDRLVYLDGEAVGFDVRVYRQQRPFPPTIKLVILGFYEEAIFTSFDGAKHNVPIKGIPYDK
jgi:hypothetical protein